MTCRLAASGRRKSVLFFRRARPVCNYSVARNWGRGGKQLVVLCNCLNLCNVWGLQLLSGIKFNCGPYPAFPAVYEVRVSSTLLFRCLVSPMSFKWVAALFVNYVQLLFCFFLTLFLLMSALVLNRLGEEGHSMR